MNVTENSKVRSKVRSTETTFQQPAHMPSGNTTALRKYRRAFWVSQYFQKSCFPTMAYCIFCDMSQFTTPPPHPHPLSGTQIRSITGPDHGPPCQHPPCNASHLADGVFVPSTLRAPPCVSLYCGCLFRTVRHLGTATAVAEARVQWLCGTVCCALSQQLFPGAGLRW